MLRQQFTTRAEMAEQTPPDPTARCILCTLGAFLSTEQAMNNFQGGTLLLAVSTRRVAKHTHTHSHTWRVSSRLCLLHSVTRLDAVTLPALSPHLPKFII